MLYAYLKFPQAVGMLSDLERGSMTTSGDNNHGFWRTFRLEILQGPSDWVSQSAYDDPDEGTTQLSCLLQAISNTDAWEKISSLTSSTCGDVFWEAYDRPNSLDLATMENAFNNLGTLDVKVLNVSEQARFQISIGHLARFLNQIGRAHV